MQNILSLPREILIIICQNLTLRSILTVRLVHSTFAALVLDHSQSIAPSVAATTFPDAHLLIRTTSHGNYGFDWLKSLVTKYLAAFLVDRFHLSSTQHFYEPLWIPAESEVGEELRARVQNGWLIIQRLGNLIARYYDFAPRAQTRIPYLNFIRPGAIFTRRRDRLTKAKATAILSQRIKTYLHDLPIRSVEDYRMTTFLLNCAFLTKHHRAEDSLGLTHGKPHEGPDDFDWNVSKGIALERNNSWVNYAIFRLGPWPFFEQWCPTSDRVNHPHVKRKLLDLWDQTSTEEIDMQRQIAAFIDNAIYQRTDRNMLLELSDEFGKYMAEGATGVQGFQGGETLPDDWMKGLSYFIDFANPDGAVDLVLS